MIKSRLQILSLLIVLTLMSSINSYAGMACAKVLGASKSSQQQIQELMPQLGEVYKAMAHYKKTQKEAIELLPIGSDIFHQYYSAIQETSDSLRLAKAKKDLKEVSRLESNINDLISTFAMSIFTPDVNSDSGKSLKLYNELKEAIKRKGFIDTSDIIKSFITLEYINSDVAAVVWNKALKFSATFDSIDFHSRRILVLNKKMKELQKTLSAAGLQHQKDKAERELKLVMDELVIHMEAITQHYYAGNIARDFQNMNPEFRF